MKKSVKMVSTLALAVGLGFASSAMAQAVVPGTYIYSQFASVAVNGVSVQSVTVGNGLKLNKIQTGPLSKGAGGAVTAIVQDATPGANSALSAKVTYSINAGAMGQLTCVVDVSSPNVNKADGLVAVMDPTCNSALGMLFHTQAGGGSHPNNPGITVDWKLAQ